MDFGKDDPQGYTSSFPGEEGGLGGPRPGSTGDAPSDEDLLVSAGGGSTEAFAELVRRHHATAYRTAYRFLGDAEEARDMAQEAFLHLLRSCAGYTPRASFRSYLYRIVSNLCADYRRKLRPVAVADLPELPSESVDPPGALAVGEREEAVRRALGKLPARQRMAVILRYFEGLGYREMARALETSEKAVERLLDRGREALLRDLGPHLRP